MQLGYAIVMVGDMHRSVAFYRDVVGLELRFESPHWSEFATGAATLALHHADPPPGPAGSAARPVAGQCRPGLTTDDLDAFHARMVGHGVRCVQKPEMEFGTRLAQYVDPDGLALSVSEARRPR